MCLCLVRYFFFLFFFFKQKTAYEMRISDWSSDVCSSDLLFNLWYGVVPHQWITLADNEWSWRSDRLVAGPWGILEANRFLPFTITYVVLQIGRASCRERVCQYV